MTRGLFTGLVVLAFTPMAMADDLAVIEDSGQTTKDRVAACRTLAKRVAPDDSVLCESVVAALGRVFADEQAHHELRECAGRALFPYHRHLKPIVPQLRAVHRGYKAWKPDALRMIDRLDGLRVIGPREVILDLLARCDEAGVPALAEILVQDDREQRLIVAEYLAEMGPTAAGAIPALRKCLRSDDPELCIRAAEALLVIDWLGESAEMVPFLARMYTSEPKRGGERAWLVLKRLGPRAAGALPELRGNVASGRLIFPTLRLIRGMGPVAREVLPDVRRLLDRLSRNTLEQHDTIATAAFLWQVGRDRAGLALLFDAIERGDPFDEYALQILGETGRGDREVWQGLRRLRDRVPAERLPHLLIALWETAPVDEGDHVRFDGREEAVDGLIPLLDGTRRETFWLVSYAGIKSPRLVPPLRKLISPVYEGADTLDDAVKLLGDIGSPARSAVPRLWQIANESQPRIMNRQSAALAVAQIDPSRTDAALRLFAQLDPPDLRGLRDRLVAFGPRGRVLVPFLRQRIGGPSRGDYLAASAILWAIDPDEARRLGLPQGKDTYR